MFSEGQNLLHSLSVSSEYLSVTSELKMGLMGLYILPSSSLHFVHRSVDGIPKVSVLRGSQIRIRNGDMVSCDTFFV